MTNAKYWIWLQTAFGYGSTKPVKILEAFPSAKEFYKAGINGWKTCKYLSTKDLVTLRETPLERAEKIIDHCKYRNYSILTPDDESYPERLMHIKAPPAVLFIKGKLPDIDNEPIITIVGTRKCSQIGSALAQTLGYRLSRCGMVVVSGGAIGCDIAATKGALEARKPSIIVLGCGLSYPYLSENAKYRAAVANNGAVISEFQPNQPASKFTFPVRNRLMSALSLGVMMVEAPVKSGALITVEYALEQGKDVFTVPGAITSFKFSGNNRLLEDGANMVYTPYDIVSEYINEFPHKMSFETSRTPLREDRMFISLIECGVTEEQLEDTVINEPIKNKTAEIKQNKPVVSDNLSDINAKVYNCFTNEPIGIDKIIENTQLNSSDVLVAITELEIEGYIVPCGGGRYKKV